jgi:hypothetical protein
MGFTVEQKRAEMIEAQKKAGSWTKMKDANGVEVDVQMDDYIKMLGDQIRAIELGLDRDISTQEKNLTRSAAAKKKDEDDLVTSEEAESQLNLNASKGVDVTKPLADRFNRHSTKDYIYTPTQGYFGGKSMSKLAIPEFIGTNGKPVKLKARDVTALAAEAKITPEQYLDQLYTKVGRKKVYQ